MEIHLGDIRRQKELTVRKLSELSGVSIGQISNVETGKVSPTLDVVCKLSKALGVSPYELFTCD